MKKVTFLSVIVLCLGGLVQADWDKIATLSSEFEDAAVEIIYFVDTSHGWLFGIHMNNDRQFLLKSNNSGKSWIEQLVDSRLECVRDICFVDNNTGWMVGESKQSYGDSLGLIYKTEDGGSSWQLVLEGKDIFRPRKIVFPTKEIGYIFSSSCSGGNSHCSEEGYGAILRTKDGGNNWLKNNLNNFSRNFLDAHFINTDTGWVVGGHYWGGDTAGFMMKTVNGGETWDFKSTMGIISASELRSVFFVNGNNGWIGGRRQDNNTSRGSLAYTEDGGNTWAISVFPGSGGVWGRGIGNIHFLNDSVGWIVETSKRLHFTEDRGMNWNIMELPGSQPNINSYFLDSKYAWYSTHNIPSKPEIYRTTDYGGYFQGVSVKPNLRPKSQSLQQFNIRVSSASNGMTNIHYRLNKEISLSLSVYNLKGVNIASQPQISLKKGEHKFSVKIPKGFYIVEAKIYNGTKENKFTQKIFVR